MPTPDNIGMYQTQRDRATGCDCGIVNCGCRDAVSMWAPGTSIIPQVAAGDCSLCCQPTPHSSNLPSFDPSGGALSKIDFPDLVIRQSNNAITMNKQFTVEVQSIPGNPKDYTLITGILKTNSAGGSSEVELQVNAIAQFIRIQPLVISIDDGDSEGSIRIFVKLIRTSTGQVLAEQYSPEWQIQDLKAAFAKRRSTSQRITLLPY